MLRFVAIILVLIGSYFVIDFLFGRKRHVKEATPEEYPLRLGECQLVTDGATLFDDLFNEIATAKNHVHVLFYIIRNDEISKEFLELLKRKAKEGLDVRLLLDAIGSIGLNKQAIQELKASGVHFSFINKPKGPFWFYSLNRRNHRKITVVDGKIGYLGGFNIGKEYLGMDPKLGMWRDYHLKLINDGVQDLQRQFLLDWLSATGEDLSGEQLFYPNLPKGSVELQLLATNGTYMKDVFLQLIHQAKTSIMIGTPYFIPDSDLHEALVSAAERGVNVTILVPMKADHPFVKEASFPFFTKLLKVGCKIYQYRGGFYHAKVLIVDEAICDIGTANFDKRSLHLNDEINCFIHEPRVVMDIVRAYRRDLATSDELTYERFEKRSIVHRGKELFAQLLSDFL